MPILEKPKYELFAQHLAKGKTADDAYELAGFNRHRSNAARLSADERIKARVAEILSESAANVGITRERIQAELAKIAFADIRKAVKWGAGIVVTDEKGIEHVLNDVSLISSDKIDDDTAAAISEIGRSKDGALKLKFHDKQKALELLGKDIGMFKDTPPVVNVNIIDRDRFDREE